MSRKTTVLSYLYSPKCGPEKVSNVQFTQVGGWYYHLTFLPFVCLIASIQPTPGLKSSQKLRISLNVKNSLEKEGVLFQVSQVRYEQLHRLLLHQRTCCKLLLLRTLLRNLRGRVFSGASLRGPSASIIFSSYEVPNPQKCTS